MQVPRRTPRSLSLGSLDAATRTVNAAIALLILHTCSVSTLAADPVDGELSVAELASELGIESRRVTFTFDRPVIAECWIDIKTADGDDKTQVTRSLRPTMKPTLSFTVRNQHLLAPTPSKHVQFTYGVDGNSITYLLENIFADGANVTQQRQRIEQPKIGEEIVLFLRAAAWTDYRKVSKTNAEIERESPQYWFLRARFTYAESNR